MKIVMIKRLKSPENSTEARDYAQWVLREILHVPEDRTAGAKYEELARNMPIIKKFNEVGEVPVFGAGAPLILEDAEWTIVCDRLREVGFMEVREEAKGMCDAFFEAPEYEVPLPESDNAAKAAGAVGEIIDQQKSLGAEEIIPPGIEGTTRIPGESAAES